MYVSTNLTAVLSEKHVQSIWLSLNEFDCLIQVITAVTSFYPAASNSSVEARQKHRTTMVVDNIVGYDMVQSDNLMNKLDLYIPSTDAESVAVETDSLNKTKDKFGEEALIQKA